jgi:diguanylate cyclase (GGDEF)-like protein
MDLPKVRMRGRADTGVDERSPTDFSIRAPSWRYGWLGVIFLSIVAPAAGSTNPVDHLPTLVTAQEVHRLRQAEAARAYPVHLHGVVTYFDPDLNDLPDLFVCDQTGCVFVEFSEQPNLKLQAGDIVDVSGVSGPGEFAPVIARPVVTRVGHSHLPYRAGKATFAGLQSGSLDGQWVEVEGVVHAAHYTRTNVTLDLAIDGGSLRASAPREPSVDYDALIDSSIRIRGNMAPVFNWKTQMVGAQLLFPGSREIKVVEEPKGDPLYMPAVAFSQLARFSPALQIHHRVHVRGSLNLLWPGRVLCIQQGNSSLCMDTAQTDDVQLGTTVDVIGFPAINSYKETLENATFRPEKSSSALPTARPIDGDDLISGEFDGKLVNVEGQIVDFERIASDLRVMVRSGNILIPGIIPLNLLRNGTWQWKEGSLVRLTGLCDSQADSDTWNLHNGEVRPAKVQLLLRSTADVQILKRPSWWSPGHALQVLLFAGLVSIVALAWIVVLRRRVSQQTKALRESQEKLRYLSEHDALTDLPNRNLLQDRIEVALARARRFQTHLGLLLVDVDHFKGVNDTYGHQAGDRLLREFARRIGSSVRATDTVARIGGDEFVVLLPDLSAAQEAAKIAAKILNAVSTPIDLAGAKVSVTASIGISAYPACGTNASALLASADAAMYSAKAKGRNCVGSNLPMGV